MDGIVEELLRLEGAKRQALVTLDPVGYETAVREQVRLIDDPRISAVAAADTDKLLAFSKIARINTGLYENLLATLPWVPRASRSYTGLGYLLEPQAIGGFSAKA